MIQLSHRTLNLLGGSVWLAIGLMLFITGIRLLFVVPTSSAMLLMVAALFIGYLKGKFVMAKAAKRQINRIASLENPTSIKNIYSKGYYLLILAMMGLGMSLRFLPISSEVRGFIDTAVGAALINGAMHYFRTTLIQRLKKT